jgi:multisubunit Na+/H+ antiporter MnhG subunit
MTSLILFSDFFSFELYLIVFAFYTVFCARPGYGSIFRNSIAISFRFMPSPLSLSLVLRATTVIPVFPQI